MSDRRVFLKVKIKSLAEEARIIKREEQRRKVRHFHNVACNPPTPEWKDLAAKARKLESGTRAERRAKPWYPLSAQELHELHRHRIDVVRVEARISGIAYALIRGRELSCVDSLTGLLGSHWERIAAMLKKYGDPASDLAKLKGPDLQARVTAPVKQAA